jgi:hypothetical protein
MPKTQLAWGRMLSVEKFRIALVVFIGILRIYRTKISLSRFRAGHFHEP